MTSVPKSDEPNVTRGKESEDNDAIKHPPTVTTSPIRVQPCCRLPKEIVKDSTSSPRKDSSSELASSSANIKVEASFSSPPISKGQEIEAIRIEEKTPILAKSFCKLENRTGSDGHDVIGEVSMIETPPVSTIPSRGFLIVDKNVVKPNEPSNVAVPRNVSSKRAPPNLEERPLLLATHLVPSLPIALFEILAEIMEVATGKAVVLLYEPRVDRPVAKDLVDIAILPASEDWTEGSLLPVSFVFEHRLNKEKKPSVYVDIVVAPDCIRNVEEVIDLRGYRCALPDRRKTLGAAGLLFRHLKSKGENPSFFGNTLDSGSQIAALQMVAGKQAEVGVLESPVINNHRKTLPGVDSLYILASLGPLPPYRIMLNKKFEAAIRDKIKEYLLKIEDDKSWMERLRSFGIIGFAEYSEDRYDLEDVKNVVTSVPYY